MVDNPRPRVLFIDAYDSFSNNIISLLESILDVSVSVIKIDTSLPIPFAHLIKDFDAIVAGPGPGDPSNPDDVGNFEDLWRLPDEDLRPVLGICLGFQSMVFSHGGHVERLPEPRHGLVRTVRSSGQSIFKGLPSLETVQYHSLHAIVGEPASENVGAIESRVRDTSDLVPLAWEDVSAKEQDIVGNDKGSQDRILMAVKHRTKPFYGVQFHPESIKSSAEARLVVRNWWDEVSAWWKQQSSIPRLDKGRSLGQLTNGSTASTPIRELANGEPSPLRLSDVLLRQILETPKIEVCHRTLACESLDIPSICSILDLCDNEVIILDSERHQNAELGRFSIIGIVDASSWRFEHFVHDAKLTATKGGHETSVDLNACSNDPFQFFENFMSSRRTNCGNSEIPFWGGLMGYVTYEACLQCLETETGCGGTPFTDPNRSKSIKPAVGFAYVERSIVVDHLRGEIVVQSIKPLDQTWVDSTHATLRDRAHHRQDQLPQQPARPHFKACIRLPEEFHYKSRIRQCKDAIRAGDSYELCLTDAATIEVSERLPAWPLYLRLRQINPAPFASFIRLGPLSFLSSSPERFMKWSRPIMRSSTPDFAKTGQHESLLQYRPIKGTVTRYDASHSRERTLSEATAILSTPKEQAENLMIVDLIRHDLHGVCGSGNVSVPKLMAVEEYKTVFQLVSVIEGRMTIDPVSSPGSMLSATQGLEVNGTHQTNGVSKHQQHPQVNDRAHSSSRTKPSTPCRALPATLPPGSMTGAPKLRSCQILQALEGKPRGAYSGVVGYMDVGGGGDWSVSIRCASRWDAETVSSSSSSSAEVLGANDLARHAVNGSPQSRSSETWTVGAGGAVTSLSTEEGEWQEMLGKLRATLRLFEA